MDIMELGIEEARKTMNEGFGGPFGAVIVDSNNNVIAVASNTVLKDNDPTAHAEINAIRKACKKLNTHDLTGYKIYATGYPCPMCLSAIIWSNIKEVYYGTDLNDAEKIGFRDQKIYDFINKKDLTLLDIEKINYEILNIFKWIKTNKEYIIYTDNTVDLNGNLNVYASIYENNKLVNIETDEEWFQIEKILKNISSGGVV